MKITLLVSVSLLAISGVAQRLEIKSLPSYHAGGSAVYIAGSFNGWNPGDENYRFQKNEAGNYVIDLKLAPGNYEYKITRGSWEQSECLKGGAAVSNRVLAVPASKVIELKVEEWSDRFPPAAKKVSASAQVHIIDTAFLVPQLNRTRRVWIYLPKDYATSKKKYPVLYMHDGQNLFDQSTAYAGEWGIDEFLDSTVSRQCIVVGVDHGGQKRMNEYNPYDNTRFGKGEGDAYVDFLVKSLKPFIDKNYRTIRGRENTMIAGSSMGGLISMYAMLKYPKVFGVGGVFSPSFWITEGRIYTDIAKSGKNVKGNIYIYGGKLEGDEMVPDMLKAYEALVKVSKAKVQVVVRDDGRHNELTWRKEFPVFYSWTMGNKN